MRMDPEGIPYIPGRKGSFMLTTLESDDAAGMGEYFSDLCLALIYGRGFGRHAPMSPE